MTEKEFNAVFDKYGEIACKIAAIEHSSTDSSEIEKMYAEKSRLHAIIREYLAPRR